MDLLISYIMIQSYLQATARSDFGYIFYSFVAEPVGRRVAHVRAAINVQVGSADSCPGHLNDCIGLVNDGTFRQVHNPGIIWVSLPDNGSHRSIHGSGSGIGERHVEIVVKQSEEIKRAIIQFITEITWKLYN